MKTGTLEEKLNFVYHKSHMDWSEIEPGPVPKCPSLGTAKTVLAAAAHKATSTA
jgi:hypothetical protein